MRAAGFYESIDIRAPSGDFPSEVQVAIAVRLVKAGSSHDVDLSFKAREDWAGSEDLAVSTDCTR